MTFTLPRPSEIEEGWKSSILLLRMQWRGIRTKKAKLLIIFVVLMGFSALVSASHAGSAIIFIATEQTGVVQQYALNYLASFMRGELGGIGAGAFGLCVISAILSPFTGAVSTSLVPPNDLVGMSIPRWHRFTDSIIAQSISSISLLQLITLTALSSMLTLGGGRSMGIVFTWFSWMLLVSISIASLWASEFLYRRFGRASRRFILIGAGALLGVGLLLDKNHGSTFFGVGSIYAEGVRTIGNMNIVGQIVKISIVGIISIIVAYLAAMLSAGALSLPERATENKNSNVYSGRFAIKGNSFVPVLLRTILRSPEVRKPIFSGIVMGAVLVTAMPDAKSITSTFTIVIPLIVALAWGSNALGHFGGGMAWMNTVPGLLNRVPWTIFWTQVAMSLGTFTIIWLPSIVLGHAGINMVLPALLASMTSTAIIARSATFKSILHPTMTHFGSRGASSLSPSRALNYTVRFSFFGGQAGVIVLALNNIGFQAIICGAAIIWSLVRMTLLQGKWEDSEVRSQVVNAVATD